MKRAICLFSVMIALSATISIHAQPASEPASPAGGAGGGVAAAQPATPATDGGGGIISDNAAEPSGGAGRIGPPGYPIGPQIPTSIDPYSSQQTINAQIDTLKIMLERAISTLRHAQENAALVETRYKAGVSTVQEYNKAKEAQSEAESAVAVAQRALASATTRYSLLKPIKVQIANGPIRKVADVLSKVSNIPVTVDSEVPDDLRVSISAQDTPLAQLLELIADQAHLVIAPSGNGVLLRPAPNAKVNGVGPPMASSQNPWSPEWQGSYDYINRWRAAVGLGGGGVAASIRANPRSGTATSDARITALGTNSFVLAEPGVGPRGESGLWITVYRVEGTRLVKTASGFHASPSRIRSF